MMKPKIIISIIITATLLAGLVTATLLSQTTQELRKKAATSTGTTSITLDPTSAELPVNQASTIKVLINTNNISTDGVQFKLTLQGNATIQIQPTPVSGLNVLISTVADSVITFAAITTNPQVPFSTNQPTQLASLAVTPTGAFTLTFDQTFSKIANHATGEDILLIPTNGSYTIPGYVVITATPTPGIGGQSTPTSTPTPTASPTPTPKTSTKITTKTTPSPASPSPTATPIPLLSRLFSRTPQPSPINSPTGSAEITSPEIPPFPWKMITLLSILLVAATGFTIWIWKKMRQNDLNDPTQSIIPPPAR